MMSEREERGLLRNSRAVDDHHWFGLACIGWIKKSRLDFRTLLACARVSHPHQRVGGRLADGGSKNSIRQKDRELPPLIFCHAATINSLQTTKYDVVDHHRP